MIIHISRQRYKFILSLGYGLTITEEVSPTPLNVVNGDHIYHLLGGEEDVCGSCGGIFKSVDANSPAELETIKKCIEFGHDPAEALRTGRQPQQLFFKQQLEKGNRTMPNENPMTPEQQRLYNFMSVVGGVGGLLELRHAAPDIFAQLAKAFEVKIDQKEHTHESHP